MTHDEKALNAFRDILSDRYTLIPISCMKTIHAEHLKFSVCYTYLYLVNEMMCRHYLMDDEGNAFISTNYEELAKTLNFETISIKGIMNIMRRHGLVQTKRTGGGYINVHTEDTVRIYLLDKDQNRIPAMEETKL